MTQNEMILSWLEKAPIGPMEALTELGIMRLASRIHDLRESGNEIDMSWNYVTDRYGNERRVARYTLKGKKDGAATTDQEQVGQGGAGEEKSSASGLGSWLRLFGLRFN